MNGDVLNHRRQLATGTVEARVRRRLRQEGEILCRPRNDQLGPYYTGDAHCGNPVAWNCDLEALAPECGVLRPWETVKE